VSRGKKPEPKSGDVFESRDKREQGRRVKVLEYVGQRAGRSEQYRCVNLSSTGRPMDGYETHLSRRSLRTNWNRVAP